MATWILLDDCSNSGYYCSECQKKVIKEGWSETVKKIKYCPNCGAKMSVRTFEKMNVLDKIKMEIAQFKTQCDSACLESEANCLTCNNFTFGSIFQIIDKYRKAEGNE